MLRHFLGFEMIYTSKLLDNTWPHASDRMDHVRNHSDALSLFQDLMASSFMKEEGILQ